ncbi:pyruvate dehydrogenase complex dihydrolipoamide acetyltransferase [Mesorhizobium sp. NZP2298]|uniref:pyruvate dehydrogenase complex dihydrolipoamide acetyltransferase n=1 Tax=Mesorhizobium sp. NZP2298 TaxID=2483403 RepID=UPI001555F136|nr:pyruvate dehydrogenase complex dihydrolipoamide acetyltransferase [Mesorhizobium sp. NZP2298]QKC98350.1 pyruvate dehydrogenase complex dihydrolipoamide acetyltransferase [Mesorhizobium sp. NZP2298]
MSQELLMPALAPSMTEGRLARWLVKEGDTINAGDVIAEIETDKATLEFEAPGGGKVLQILVPEGTDGVPVQRPIAILQGEGEAAPSPLIRLPEREPAASALAMPLEHPPAMPGEANPDDAGPGARIFASPLARAIARVNDLDLAGVIGSGPRQRILKADVQQLLDRGSRVAPATSPVRAPTIDTVPATDGDAPLPVGGASASSGHTPLPWQKHTAVPNNAMRRTIARRLLESKRTVPHFYLTASIDLEELLATRAKLNARPGADYKLSINDFIIKASATALRRVPQANSMWTEEAILQFEDVDISVAVSTDGGLITPVIRDADRKGLVEISNEMKALAATARAGKLKPEEYQGGGFSISNLGMYGVEHFAAIINPPQSCILAVGAGEKRAVVRGDEMAVRTMMTATLSVDHRSVDGARGAQLLAAIKAALEDPLNMIL